MCVAETVAERVQRLAAEVTVGAILHRVVLKRWKLLGGCVESDWQAARWVIYAEQRVGNGVAASFSGVPRFEDCGGILGSALQSKGSSIHKDYDKRFASCRQRRHKLLLCFGQLNPGAISSFEAVDVDGRLFPFQFGTEPEEGEGYVGFFG